MSEQENLEFVKGLYDAFSRGDAQAWIDAMADDITWQVYGPGPDVVPLGGLRVGIDQVKDFFMTMGTTLEVKRSDKKLFLSKDDQVIVVGFVHSQVRATGKEFKSEYVHILTLRDGKLVSYREYLDSAQLVEVYTPA